MAPTELGSGWSLDSPCLCFPSLSGLSSTPGATVSMVSTNLLQMHGLTQESSWLSINSTCALSHHTITSNTIDSTRLYDLRGTLDLLHDPFLP